jgi:hypothetical protein
MTNTTHPSPRGRRRADPNTQWILPVVTTFSIAAVLIALVVIYSIVDDGAPRAVSTTASTGIAVVGSTPTGGPTSVPRSPLIDNALRIKPLEDSQRQDRVIYRGVVCRWLRWDKSIATSLIKCAGKKEFRVATGRLTPVELRD